MAFGAAGLAVKGITANVAKATTAGAKSLARPPRAAKASVCPKSSGIGVCAARDKEGGARTARVVQTGRAAISETVVILVRRGLGRIL